VLGLLCVHVYMHVCVRVRAHLRSCALALQMGSPVLLQDIEVRGCWVSCVCMHVCVCVRVRARAFALVCARAANGLTSPAAGH